MVTRSNLVLPYQNAEKEGIEWDPDLLKDCLT
jgi:hypothetical protein